MKKTISLFLVMATMVSMLYTCSWASESPTVEMTEYDYKIVGGRNSYGEIYAPSFSVGSKTYLQVYSNNYSGKYALMDVESGSLILDNVTSIGKLSEYSDLIYAVTDNKNIIYDIEKKTVICELANCYRLGRSGYFSERGGFVTLESDQKLHFISNEGVIGNAVNIDHSQYANGNKYLIAPYLGEGLYELGIGDNEGLSKTIGMLNSEGKIITYVDSVNEFINGLAIVEKNDKYGLIDKYGNSIIPYEYSSINFSRYRYIARKDDAYYEFDTAGNTIGTFIPDFNLYDGVDSYIGYGLSVVYNKAAKYSDWKYGIVNSVNEIILPITYAYIQDYYAFSDDLCIIIMKKTYNGSSLYGYIDKIGNIAIPFEYDYADTFSEGLAAVKKDGKYGFIDKSGNAVISFEYDYADTFSESLAAVKKDGKYGYIDKNGSTIIPFEYNYARSFSDGVADVWLSEDSYITINKNNEIVSENKSTTVYSLTDDYDWVNNKYNGSIRINETGKTVDISHMNVLPHIIGNDGQHIIAFSRYFEKAYRIVINDESTTVAPKTEITDFTVENQDANTVANLSIANSNDSTIIYVASYNSSGKMLDLHTPAVSNGTAVATFKTTDIAELKAFIWDNKLNPIAESKSINLSK